MFKGKTLTIIVITIVALVLVGLIGGTIYASFIPKLINNQETIVLGQSTLAPGSRAGLRVAVRDHRDATPVRGARVVVSLAPQNGRAAMTLFEGTTDERGTADVDFQVPEDIGPYGDLVVETSSRLGRDRIHRSVTIQRDYKILLTTDKPLYQPGQTIHIRSLALSAFDLRPAVGKNVEITVADAKGNKVFREIFQASEYGVAGADFTLADEVNTGAYKITADMEGTTSERTVTVKHYVLPKFKVQARTDRTFYRPGERVEGTVSADYFFGKPVAEGEVTITGFLFDVERREALELRGETDEEGVFEFQFDLPDYFVGGGLEGGTATFILEVAVKDQADHVERINLGLPVSQEGIVIEAVPESGGLKPGIENILYIVTAYPDGSPAQCRLTVEIEGKRETLSTGRYGLAEYRFTPGSPQAEVRITARDEAGHGGTFHQMIEGYRESEYVLLRPQRASYRVGETMHLDILTSAQSGTAYLDIVREGQTVSTRSLDIEDGRAAADIDLTEDLFGTLELHAYKILSNGQIVRDTRLVLVDAPRDLSLAIVTDKDEYLPGEMAAVDFQVTDVEQRPSRAALGISVVDESVFALQEQDPGFAKIYFLLEKELLEPKYEIHGFTLPGAMISPAEEGEMREAQDRSAKAALAQAPGVWIGTEASPFSLSGDSYQEKARQARDRQVRYFRVVATGLLPLIVLIPLALGGITLVTLWRKEVLGLTLLTGLLLATLGVCFFAALPTPDWIRGSPLDKLGYYLEAAAEFALCLVPLLLLSGLAAFIILAIRAWRQRERGLGYSLLLLVAYIILLPLLIYAVVSANQEPEETQVIVFLIAYLIVPLSFYLRAIAFGFKRQTVPLVASALMAVFTLFVIVVPIAGVTMQKGMVGFVGAPMLQREFDMFEGEIVAAPMAIEEGMPMPTPTIVPSALVKGKGEGVAKAQEAPRLRQFFPETLYWNPEALTDEDGRLKLEIPLADSITTWRLSALASSQNGQLGSNNVGLRVFQDFFIDLDLPVSLTQHDEVAVPVAVYNYLPQAQTVRLTLKEEPWFEMKDDIEKELTIAANDIEVVYFRFRVTAFGHHRLRVTAWGERMSDAIEKEITVYPDGEKFETSQSDRLGEDVKRTVTIPQAAIDGTAEIMVKVYPGIMSQVVEGLESILRMPYGCFEQTSSATYPNVLVLDYMKSTGQSTPEIEMKAEEYINLGYQRLTTFEVDGGGFSLFGDPPADVMLTAYGLMEFRDMSRVYNVDEALIQRTAQWLLSQQESDGSWKGSRGLVHESTWREMKNVRLPVTAYITWALLDAGYGGNAGAEAGLSYVKEFLSDAEEPYVLALCANALAASDPEDPLTQRAVDRLAEMALEDDGAAYWPSEVESFTGARGMTGGIETTALAAHALLRAEAHSDVANRALTYLIRAKDAYGTWYSTQATILSLKALLLSVIKGDEDVDATVRVSLNGEEVGPIRITKENFDVVQLVTFTDGAREGDNTVVIAVEGKGNLMYQVTSQYYLPWEMVPEKAAKEPMTIDVSYDRTDLYVDDVVRVDVEVQLNEPGVARWVLVDLGIPPGFQVLAEDLSALVERDLKKGEDYEGVKIKRFDLTGRQIIVYLENLSWEEPLSFSYRLRAKYPIVAKTPPSTVYDYYNPDVRDVSEPQEMVVN